MLMKEGKSITGIKAEIVRLIESQRDNLIELSLLIHSNPELGFHEVKASKWLADYLEKHDFTVDRGIGSLATAFKASYGKDGPVIALLAEYDALPGVGHACGHNIIAASAIGAGVACKYLVDRCGGVITVLGTPAEEYYGGKVTMVSSGVFDGIDIAMMVHPGVHNRVTIDALACISLDIEYFGKAAHAAASPEQGINALDAIILAFNAVNALRQQIKEKARIHGVITHGGEIANVIPDYTAAKFIIRARDLEYLEELKQKVLDCFVGASVSTGTKLKYEWGDITYDSMKNNMSLAEVFADNMNSLGRTAGPVHSDYGFGSTDMANVSHVVPAIHPIVAIASPEVAVHSVEFAEAAASEAGHNGLLDAAKALAMTVADLLSSPELLSKTRNEFMGGNQVGNSTLSR
jgi:amidohydrolase